MIVVAFQRFAYVSANGESLASFVRPTCIVFNITQKRQISYINEYRSNLSILYNLITLIFLYIYDRYIYLFEKFHQHQYLAILSHNVTRIIFFLDKLLENKISSSLRNR